MTWETNPQLEMAADFVKHTRKHLFLTGKAGSGKTTFLHQFKASGLKRMAVVAPTGVAAINAGGMTMHSLFQLPFGLHLPGVERQDSQGAPRFRPDKVRLIRSLDLLVIDEISMVRADLLDAVDQVLQKLRYNSQPFGGVQLLMIGDLHQLPPVVKPEDWELLKGYYETPYFFGSHALKATDYLTIELKRIYRQADPTFIELLNKVRDNRMDQATMQRLNQRYIPGYRPPIDQPCITLTATNAAAYQINQQNLSRLEGQRHSFKAEIKGDFPSSSYPTEETLEFKVGAQVMFIRNDPKHRYYNGKLGQITKMDAEGIWVKMADAETEIAVLPAEWKNIRYSLNESTKQVEEVVLGTFNQFPLKLAWAITIHKSQGLTFERCLIDAQSAFATGQVYVALSRCKTLEGIVLQTPIPATSIKTDPVVQDFSEEAEKNYPTPEQLQVAKRDAQVQSIRWLFDFSEISRVSRRLATLTQDHANTVPSETVEACHQLQQRVETELTEISSKFSPQLAQYLQMPELPEDNSELQARLQKAGEYFTDKLAGLLKEIVGISDQTDNQSVTMQLENTRLELARALSVKRATYEVCRTKFSGEALQRAKVNAELGQGDSAAGEGKPVNVPKNVLNPELYRQLVVWRTGVMHEKQLSDFEVLPNKVLRQIVTYLPTDKAAMLQLSGFGSGRFQRYGQAILERVQKYLQENPDAKPPVRLTDRDMTGVTDTQRLTFELWLQHGDAAEIARRRGMAMSTILGHLVVFVERGDVPVDGFVGSEARSEILGYFATHPEAKSSEAIQHFGEKYSYDDLRFARAHQKYVDTTAATST